MTDDGAFTICKGRKHKRNRIEPNSITNHERLPDNADIEHTILKPGVFDNKSTNTPELTNVSTTTVIPLCEIIAEEQSKFDSLRDGRCRIKTEPALSKTLKILETKFPQMSPEALEDIFIECDFNQMQTINKLNNSGHKPLKTEHNHQSVSTDDNLIKLKQMEENVNVARQNRDNIKNRLSNLTNRRCDRDKRDYLNDELARSTKLMNETELALVAQRKTVYGDRQLDLHGLSHAVAIIAVNTRIEELKSQPSNAKLPSLTIICGKGLHSIPDTKKLKSIVRRHLIDTKIVHSESSDGTFTVPLDRQS